MADGVEAGIGIVPNVELAQTAGFKVEYGIHVDASLRTSHPDIYAAGDVANFYNPAPDKRLRVEHEDKANTMGRLAGQAMAGWTVNYDHLPFSYSNLFELGYEAVGEVDSRLQTVADWKEPYREGVIYYLRDSRVRGVLLWNVWEKVDAARNLIAEPGPFRPESLKGRCRPDALSQSHLRSQSLIMVRTMPQVINPQRRLFLGTAVMTAVASQFGPFVCAQSVEPKLSDANTARPGMNRSLGPLRRIDAGVLNVGYAEAGPVNGPPVVLLHGWPYDIHSFVDVAPLLASKGYRVIVPYLRGYGTTRFLSPETMRNGQPSAVALDTIALMDALKIEKATLAGFDWGARTANIIGALWPQRCKGMVSVSGYLIGSQAPGKVPLPPKAELQWWYQFYLATERGRAGYDKYRHDFNKLIWQLASPKWNFDDATFDRSAQSFNNPDHVAVVIHNYRWRQDLAEGERRYDELEKKLAESPVIDVPTITMEGDSNGAPHPDPSAYAKMFSGKYAHRTISGGIGHNLPQEAPQAFADAVLEVSGW